MEKQIEGFYLLVVNLISSNQSMKTTMNTLPQLFRNETLLCVYTVYVRVSISTEFQYLSRDYFPC